MSVLSVHRLLQAFTEAQRPENRYQDLCLVLRDGKTQETLLYAGGRFDHQDKQFVRTEPELARVIDMRSSQVEFVQWFATWLKAFREGLPRDLSAAIAIGGRRGGKTHMGLLCTLATLVDVPRIQGSELIGWLISVSHAERDELDREVQENIPSDWYTYREWPKHRYLFAHGPTLTNISADDPDTVKRGRADIIFQNEGAKMSSDVLFNAVGAVADKGGLVVVATNAPRREKGSWVFTEWQAYEKAKAQGILHDVKFFPVDSSLNDVIDADARKRAGNIMKRLDPAGAKADDEGLILPVGEYAYYEWNEVRNGLYSAPRLADITAEFTKRKTGYAYEFLGGADFQGTPHMAASVWKIFGTLEQPELWCLEDFIVERGNEDQLLDEVDERGLYTPENLLWIGDASGDWQDGKHRSGKDSWSVFRARRWHIEGPQPKRGQKTKHGANPPIHQRVSLINRLLSEQRLMVDPHAARMQLALKQCKSKQGKYGAYPAGLYAHLTDTAGYVAWWVMPPRKAAGKEVSTKLSLGRRKVEAGV